jgi:hypothetical protein
MNRYIFNDLVDHSRKEKLLFLKMYVGNCIYIPNLVNKSSFEWSLLLIKNVFGQKWYRCIDDYMNIFFNDSPFYELINPALAIIRKMDIYLKEQNYRLAVRGACKSGNQLLFDTIIEIMREEEKPMNWWSEAWDSGLYFACINKKTDLMKLMISLGARECECCYGHDLPGYP